MHINDAESVRLFEEDRKLAPERRRFVPVRKAPENVLAMKRIVYDNDHPANDLVGKQPPRWAGRADSGWAAGKENDFTLAAPGDDKTHWLQYRHLLRGEGDRPRLITDFMGYDTAEAGGHRPPGENWVGDLLLEAEVQTDKPQGELTLELTKGVDRFRARFDLATGAGKLLRVTDDGQDGQLLDEKQNVLKGGGTHQVRFANIDGRLTVWVDDALPFGDGVVYDPPQKEGPTEKDLEPASIGVKGAGATVRHVRLWRDTYYTVGQDTSQGIDPSAPDGGRASVDFGNKETWGALAELPVRTLYVQPGHYLCLGDNSTESSDGRSWGLVPERLLLGKALLVYYPPERFGRIH
jgi:signal peptidase I